MRVKTSHFSLSLLSRFRLWQLMQLETKASYCYYVSNPCLGHSLLGRHRSIDYNNNKLNWISTSDKFGFHFAFQALTGWLDGQMEGWVLLLRVIRKLSSTTTSVFLIARAVLLLYRYTTTRNKQTNERMSMNVDHQPRPLASIDQLKTTSTTTTTVVNQTTTLM